MTPITHKPDPKLDLVLERTVDVPPELVWAAWTRPEYLKQWFCPVPWKTVECEIDLRPGGAFHTVMQSPEGEKFPNYCCYLEIVENRKLVWTDALDPGYRPAAKLNWPDKLPNLTVIITMEPHGKGGTRYVAMALHRDEESRDRHEKLGFYEGWGTTFDQLVALAKTM